MEIAGRDSVPPITLRPLVYEWSQIAAVEMSYQPCRTTPENYSLLEKLVPEPLTTRWVVTAFNFIVPMGAVIDKLWARHLAWAAPLGSIGGPVWDMTQGRMAVVLAVIWTTGALAVVLRLISRLRRERREAQVPACLGDHEVKSGLVADGVPVSFNNRHRAPAVGGVLYPRILLPIGIDRLLNRQELNAVLLLK
jgi:hypothetical protein